jgi:hypothetical protein
MLEKRTIGFSSIRLETVANVATIVVAGLLSVVLIKTYLLPVPSPRMPIQLPATESAAIGTHLAGRLAGVNWKENGRTVVLALSTRCHFCTESAPFFRKLKKKAGKDIKIIGVLPQPVAESESYLKGEGLHVDQVKQVTLASIGVNGTPTILLLDANGTVTGSWVGKLQPEDEDRVLAAILGPRSAGLSRRGEPVRRASFAYAW